MGAFSRLALILVLIFLSEPLYAGPAQCADSSANSARLKRLERSKTQFESSFNDLLKLNRNLKENQLAVDLNLAIHLQATKEILDANGVSYQEVVVAGEKTIEILADGHGHLNHAARTLSEPIKTHLVYMPLLLVKRGYEAAYAGRADLFLIGKDSVVAGRIGDDPIFFHEAIHRYFDILRKNGDPSPFSTWILWSGQPVSRADVPKLIDGYRMEMSADELVTNAQVLSLASRMLRRTLSPEEQATYANHFMTNLDNLEGITQNIRLGLAAYDKFKANLPMQGFKLKVGKDADGIETAGFEVDSNRAILIQNVNENVLEVNFVTYSGGTLRVSLPGNFQKLAAKGFIDATTFREILAATERSNARLLAATDALAVALQQFHDRSESAANPEEFVRLASAPRRALSPWLNRSTRGEIETPLHEISETQSPDPRPSALNWLRRTLGF